MDLSRLKSTRCFDPFFSRVATSACHSIINPRDLRLYSSSSRRQRRRAIDKLGRETFVECRRRSAQVVFHRSSTVYRMYFFVPSGIGPSAAAAAIGSARLGTDEREMTWSCRQTITRLRPKSKRPFFLCCALCRRKNDAAH